MSVNAAKFRAKMGASASLCRRARRFSRSRPSGYSGLVAPTDLVKMTARAREDPSHFATRKIVLPFYQLIRQSFAPPSREPKSCMRLTLRSPP